MTVTEACPDTTTLDQLDFEETCRRCVTPWSDRCGARANWLIIKNCCGAQTFVCDPHLRNTPSVRSCLDCGSHLSAGPFKAWRI